MDVGITLFIFDSIYICESALKYRTLTNKTAAIKTQRKNPQQILYIVRETPFVHQWALETKDKDEKVVIESPEVGVLSQPHS